MLITRESVVQSHLGPLCVSDQRGRSSVGRTPALHAGGREFNSPRLHLEAKNCFLKLKLVSIGFKLYELSVFLSCLNSLGIKLKT